jgi:hypothetical protein
MELPKQSETVFEEKISTIAYPSTDFCLPLLTDEQQLDCVQSQSISLGIRISKVGEQYKCCSTNERRSNR